MAGAHSGGRLQAARSIQYKVPARLSGVRVRVCLFAVLLTLLGGSLGAVELEKFGGVANDGHDDTPALLKAIAVSNVINFRQGTYDFDGPLLKGYNKALARFRWVGVAPVTTWQHEQQGLDRTWTKLALHKLPA